ncbi:uncharacterized protein [Asterias amurensis]|uniref:uncharacterized protein n=1 Tax=Asterias amurensis TaxID=7602 RepID=UPI003AB4B0A8
MYGFMSACQIMAGRSLLLLLFVSSALMFNVDGLISTSYASHRTSQRCSDAEVYLMQDWDLYASCCDQHYPNETCPIACPCRNGAECFPSNRTCGCKPGWVGVRCQRSCREKNNITYGQDCKRRCRCGPDASCDPVTGLCECIDSTNCTSRCPVNRYGPKCRWKCRCRGGCDHMTGSCDNADESYRTCDCLNGGSCQARSQSCRCQPGWTGGRCGEPCPSGFYGEECALSCGCGDNSTCSVMTGLCSCAGENKYSCSGRCPPGVYGPRCSYQCNCPSRLTCNQLTGDCQCTDRNDCQEILHGTTTQEPNKINNEVTTAETTPTPANTTTEAIPSTFPTGPPTSTRHTARKTVPTASPDTQTDGIKSEVDGTSSAGAAEESPQRNDGSPGSGDIGFYPSAPFWGVVSAIAVLLLIVVVLLILILRRQMTSKSPLTRRTKIGRQDNVYETVEELCKGTPEPEAKLAPPPLPDMFQRGGPARSSLRSFHHRPISVHSPLASLDAPLPASVAALVCNYGGPPPVPGGTSRRSLMAEWRPYSRPERLAHENRAKSRSHSSLTDLPHQTDPVGGYNAIFVEDDYADPFDTILPSLDVSNRSSGYFASVREGSSPMTSQNSSPVTLRKGGSRSPMTTQRCSSPMTSRESPVPFERSSSPMEFQERSGSPMPVKQRHSDYNMNSFRSISPATVTKDRPYSAAMSNQRTGSPVTDPFYFTLEQHSPAGSPAGIIGPEDDYDEVDPQSPPINSPSRGVLVAAIAGSPSERSSHGSSTSSRSSSRASLGANSPTLSSPYGTSPRDVEMYDALDNTIEKTRPRLPKQQRPLSSNVYESCGPRLPPLLPTDDHAVYSKLNRNPSQRSEHRGSLQRRPQEESPYGRLERSYSARNAARTPGVDELQGRVPQRSRSAMVKGNQGTRSTECVAGEWVPAEPAGHRPLLPQRTTKSPLVTEPRKKFRFSLKGKKQLTKKSSTDELDQAVDAPSSTLPPSC